MKRIKVIILVICILLILPTVYAGTAYVDSIDIDAKINKDGSMKVVETIRWDIEEDLNGVYRDILINNASNSLNSATGIDVNSVVVDGVPFLYSPTTLYNGIDGKYNVNSISGGKQIKIFTPSEDEYKTTIITYTLHDVVVEYNDIAELYWNFIGNGWEYGIDNVNINITLPGKSNVLKIFGHGPLNGYSQIINKDSLNLSVNGLRRGEQVDARVLFDNSLVTSKKVVNENKLEDILLQESKLAEQANLKRQMAKNVVYIAILVVIVSFVLPILMYIKEKKNSIKATFNGKYYRELPEDYGPAVMNKLLYPLNSHTNSNDMLATLLDLVRRKYVEIVPVMKEGKKKPNDYLLKLINTDISLLNEQEQYFIEHLIFADTNEITLKELTKKNTKTTTAQKEAYNSYVKWTEKITKVAQEKDLLNREKTKVGKIGIFCILSLIALFVVLAYGAMNSYDDIIGIGGIGLVITIFELIIVIFAIEELKIRTEKGVEHKAMWKAFKKFLLDFSKLDEHEYKSIAIWEHYLVYATGLGIAKKVMKELKIVFPTEFENESDMFRTYATIGLLSDNNIFSSFSSSFTTATSTAFSSPSSNGSGGGFSGGAGAGGGGGGGGGF